VYNTPLGIAADRNGNVFVVDGLGESNTVVLKEATPNGGYFINSPLPVGLIFNNTTGIISGTPIVATPATNYTITAYNISGSASANLNISVLLNNDHLANLKVDSGKLSPAFSSSITSYTDSVSSDSLRITPVLIDTLGTVTVGGTIVKSGMALRVPLIVGSNIIPIKVTASDGITSQTYTLTVKRSPPSSNAGLSNIVLNNGTLSPGFSTSVTSYTAITTYGNITVTPTALNQYATIAVNGQAVNSRSTSGPIPLRFGVNTLTTKVTAQDGTVQNYTITLTRLHASSIHTLAGLFVNEGTLTPAFNADSFHYADRVTDTTAFITVRPKPADATETIMVNDTVLASGNPSGTVSPQIPLVAGYNVIRILVTSQNGLQRYYVINVIKPRSPDANLDSLVISKGTLSPSFNADTTTYTDSVSNSTIGVAIKAYPENPYTTLRINGIKTAPGVESANIPLKVGNTILQVAVRAQDGEIKNYTINLNRAASSNADLDTIVLGPRTPYSPVFNPDSIYYTAYVANKVTQLAIRAQTSVTTSTLKMNQIIVYNNQISPVPLMVGSNPVIYQVTAQDGITTKTYNFNIIRASADTGTTDLVNRPSLDDGLIVHQAITPNGDGINDVLTIDKIAAFPNNKLMIISNSGALVNEASRYDNKLKAFDGHSSINGKLLPAGTYFYSLQYTINGKSKTKTGYVVLKY
jgi:gliding motility-associated-like protein